MTYLWYLPETIIPMIRQHDLGEFLTAKHSQWVINAERFKQGKPGDLSEVAMEELVTGVLFFCFHREAKQLFHCKDNRVAELFAEFIVACHETTMVLQCIPHNMAG